MKRNHRTGLLFLLACGGISLLWGLSLQRNSPFGSLDLKGLYFGARCLQAHCDPYQARDMANFYLANGAEQAPGSIERFRVVTVFVNLPTTLFLVAPLGYMSLGLANAIWVTTIAGSIGMGAFLIWGLSFRIDARVATGLVGLLLLNCEILVAGGNAAGVVIGLCVIGAWCFIRGRLVPVGILCLAVSLVIKPHDVGFVWLYFLLAGGLYRKRALQTLLVSIAIGVAGMLWVSRVSPNWLRELQSNLVAISSPGGLNYQGPDSLSSFTAAMVINLEAVVRIFCDNAAAYHLVSYLVCGSMLVLWSICVLRSHASESRAWFALAAVVPITMLVAYHRPYDAKLLLLMIPACAILWTERGVTGWLALALTSAGILLTGDIPLAILIGIAKRLHLGTTGVTDRLLTALLTRPASLMLLALAIFYLWVYVRQTSSSPKATKDEMPAETALSRSN